MTPQGLTVLAGITPGREDALRRTLDRIGDDINGKRFARGLAEPGEVHIDFPRARRIHFARLVVIADPDNGPDRYRLLFSTNYDGTFADHVAELREIMADPDAIFGACVGYPGKDRLERFLRDHALEPDAFYIAFRDETAARIRAYRAIRVELDKMLDAGSLPTLTEALRHVPARYRAIAALAGGARRLVSAAVLGADVVRRGALVAWDFVVMTLRFGPWNVWKASRKIAATLDRLWYVRIFNRLTRNSLPPPETPYSEVATDNREPCVPRVKGDEVVSPTRQELTQPKREDVIGQNQLTLVTVVDPEQRRYLGAVMAMINLYARRMAPSGSLAGISTIHFVRWLVIDDGRRLLMLSNYDGSWEAYIDEFAEMILSGLDAIWESALGYPRGGAQDIPAFKRFLRCHQTQSNVFYSAYPNQTVLGIINDRKIARGLADRLGTDDWLRLF